LSAHPKTLLGFDYGTKRIGVAVGQTFTRTARPLETVSVKHHKPDWNRIAHLIDEWQPEALLIGMPYNDDGSEHAVTRAARRFGQQLKAHYKLPVHVMDERLSSSAARELAVTRQDVDKISAQLILQSWLDHTAQQERTP
jgi:putative Holliday junction resolvase